MMAYRLAVSRLEIVPPYCAPFSPARTPDAGGGGQFCGALSPIPLPAFLDSRTRVDFRKSQPDPLNQLIFGITGRNPAFEVE
jgi:hypothetical protein